MSDETPAPPLRLRPRLKPEGEPAAPAVPATVGSPDAAPPPAPVLFKTDAPPPSAGAASPLEGLPKLRMKPRLTTEEPVSEKPASAIAPTTVPPSPPPLLFRTDPSPPPAVVPAPADRLPPALLFAPPLPAAPGPEQQPLPPAQPVLFKTDAAPASPPPIPLKMPGSAGLVPAAPPPPGVLRPPPLRASRPPMPSTPASVADEAPPRLKLKPLGGTGVSSALGSVPEGGSLLASALNKTSVTMPPIPLPADAPLLPSFVGRAPVIHLAAPGNLPESALQPVTKVVARKGEHKPSARMGLLVVAVVLLLTCAYGAWWAYENFIASPPAEQTVSMGTPAPVGGSVASPVPAATNPVATQTLPQPAVGETSRAQAALSERRDREQQRVDSVLEGREPPVKRALETPLPGTLMPMESQPTPPLPVTAFKQPAPSPVEAAPALASQAFRRWTDVIVVSGVFQGDPPRVLINGKTLRPGDFVDKSQGIVFEGIDVERKLIIFRDSGGSTTTKKY